jgi:hypothetical protein
MKCKGNIFFNKQWNLKRSIPSDAKIKTSFHLILLTSKKFCECETASYILSSLLFSLQLFRSLKMT